MKAPLEIRAVSSTEEKATVFVRRSRLRICEQFRQQLHSSIARSNLPGGSSMSANEKIAMWNMDPLSHDWGQQGKVDPGEDDGIDPFGDQDLSDVPDGPEAREFLLGVEEYKWLLSRITAAISMGAASLGPPSVSNTFTEALAERSNNVDSRSTRLSLELAWSPAEFLSEQFPLAIYPVQLGSVIVLAGTAIDAYTTTCIDYINQLWPANGAKVLRCVQSAIESPTGESHLQVEQMRVQISCASSGTSVKATGEAVALLELAEVMTWLGTACRASPAESELAYFTPRLSRTGNGEPEFNVDLAVSPTSQEEQVESDATCWRGMFKNTVIAKDYPTPVRHNGER